MMSALALTALIVFALSAGQVLAGGIGILLGPVAFIAILWCIHSYQWWLRRQQEREAAFAILIGQRPQVNSCPGCGDATVYWGTRDAAPWQSVRPDLARWWRMRPFGYSGTRVEAISACQLCQVQLTPPVGIGACGRCSAMVELFENPHGAVARCGLCRRHEDGMASSAAQGGP